MIFAQFNHFGLNATSDSADDLRVLWGPSAVKSPAYGETPKAMEPEDIAEVVEWWARCAELSREGGFDGTEVHISHSYLLHQFLSPLYNKRDGRVRRLVREPAALRARGDRRGARARRRRTGSSACASASATSSRAALDIDDAIRVARTLEADGQIDYVNVTAAGYHNIFLAIQPSDEPDGYLVDLTAQVKAAVVGAAGVHGRRDQGSGARRGDPRLRQGGHGRDDARADRRPGVREQGAARAARTRSSTASAATRAASAASSRACRSAARSTPPPGREGRLRPARRRPSSRRAGSSPAAARQG